MRIMFFCLWFCFLIYLAIVEAMRTHSGVDLEQAQDGEFPFVVSIMQSGLHYCAGSIITPLFILTAAYCCFDNDYDLLPIEDLEVSVGSASWRKGNIFPVANIYIHNRFNNLNLQSNVALLKLQRPIMPDEFAHAVILSQYFIDEEVDTINATAVGWTTITSDKKFTSKGVNVLTIGNLITLSGAKCSYAYTLIHAEDLCMIDEVPNGVGTCSSDPGSPLVMTAGDKIVQIGISSHGANCHTGAPGVFTRISSYYPWIKSMLERAKRDTL